jgi:glycine cleavage system H protein
MVTIGPFEFPDDLYYSQDHAWAKVEGELVTVGLSQFGQHLAGDLAYVEAPHVGRQVERGRPLVALESGKWVGRIKAPVAGKVVAANAILAEECTVVNRDPYGRGWLARIAALALESDLNHLMRADTAEFAAFIAAEKARYGK